jgi:hypothetical protein
MGTKEKLLARLFRKPRDFRWAEAKALLVGLGFRELQGDGSRVKFYSEEHKMSIDIHRPHGSDPLKSYQIIHLITALKRCEIKP